MIIFNEPEKALKNYIFTSQLNQYWVSYTINFFPKIPQNLKIIEWFEMLRIYSFILGVNYNELHNHRCLPLLNDVKGVGSLGFSSSLNKAALLFPVC